jgi:hypothetical protein
MMKVVLAMTKVVLVMMTKVVLVTKMEKMRTPKR